MFTFWINLYFLQNIWRPINEKSLETYIFSAPRRALTTLVSSRSQTDFGEGNSHSKHTNIRIHERVTTKKTGLWEKKFWSSSKQRKRLKAYSIVHFFKSSNTKHFFFSFGPRKLCKFKLKCWLIKLTWNTSNIVAPETCLPAKKNILFCLEMCELQFMGNKKVLAGNIFI